MSEERTFRLRYHQWDPATLEFLFLGTPHRLFSRSELEALLEVHRHSQSNRWKIEVQTRDGTGQWFTVELHEVPLDAAT